MGDDAIVEVPDFKMKQMNRFRITVEPDQVNTLSSLVATSNQFGLLFVGSNSKILVMCVSDLVDIDSSHVKKNQEITNFPHKQILLPSSPSFVLLSSDSLTLLVCLLKSNCPVALLFDVRGFAHQDGVWGPFQEIRLSSTDGVTVHDCAWNPTTPGLVAISLSDGSLLAVEVNETQFTLNSLPSSTGAQVISWSPKGKQLVVACPGKMVQYKPDLKEAKIIPFTGGEVGMSQPKVVGLQWLSTVQFLVTFMDLADSNGRPHLFIVNSNKTGLPTFIDYDDVCYGNPTAGRIERFQSLSIPTWNILLISSANAMEVAVMGPRPSSGSTDHPSWCQWLLESTYRAELPLGGTEETRPLGMALNLSSQTQIPWADNQFLPAAPILFLLSTEGLLCPFYVINLLKPQAANINKPAETLTAAGERPALKASIPPLAASTPLSKTSVPRTNLGDRFADISALNKPSPPPLDFHQISTTPQNITKVPLPPSTQHIQQNPLPPTTQPVRQNPLPPTMQPVRQNPLPPISGEQLKTAFPLDQGMGPAALILQDEVAKFVQDLEAFKARCSNMKVSVATQEEKEKLIRMTSELSDFGADLVSTTKTQDEEVRALYTELTEVAALLEDARIRHARRRNPRYGQLLKLRPLDPANRRKLDGIERLHVHIEQQLEEASRILDSIGRSGSSTESKASYGNRKIEIPITQVIYEALKNNARVILQLTNRLDKIKAQSNEQQLKLAGAAFEALRIKDGEPKNQWDSELAILADSLLSNRIDSKKEASISSCSPTPSSVHVIPQVSPEKQALLRDVLSSRPVTRIRAIRPETASESRLLSNLNSLSSSKKQLEEFSVQSSPPPSTSGIRQKPDELIPAPLGKTSSIILTEVEDITPPCTPINTAHMDMASKSLTGQKLVSGFTLIPRTTSTSGSILSSSSSSITTTPKPIVPACSAPPPPVYSSIGSISTIKPTAASSIAGFGTPSGSLFGPGKAFSPSAFSAATPPSISSNSAPFGSPSAFSVANPVSSSSALISAGLASLSTVFSAAPASSGGTFFGSGKSPTTPLSAYSSTISVVKSTAVTPSVTHVTTPSKSDKSQVIPSMSTPQTITAPQVTITSASTTNIVPNTSSFFGTSATTAPLTTSVVTVSAVSVTLPTKPAAGNSFSFATPPVVNPAASSFSFALPQTAVPAVTSAGLFGASSSSSIPSATSSSFSFSLAGNKTSTTAPATTTAPLFSLTPSSKPPTAFGVVSSSSTPSGPLFGQSPAVTSSLVLGKPPATTASNTNSSSVFGQSSVITSSSVFGQSPAVTSTSVFGQSPAVTSTSVFGQSPVVTSTSVFGQSPAVTSTSVFGQSPVVTSSSVFGQSPIVPAATATSSLFGQAAVTNAGLTSLFGQGQPLGTSTTASSSSAQTTAFGSASAFGGSSATIGTPVFGATPAASSGTSTVAGSFSSSGFGGQSGGGPFGQSQAITGSTTSSVFGKPSTFGSVGSSSVFGQPAGGSGGNGSTAGSTSSGFGVSSPIGQSVFGGSAFGQPGSTSTAFGGSTMFGGMGLGATPNAANANRNVFGGGTAFGSSGSSAFGATSPGSPAVASPSPSAFASPIQGTGFGQQSSAGFGQPATFGSPASAFGGAPAFGTPSPAFGGPATFGGSPNPMFGGKPTFGSPAAPLSPPKVETGGFGAFAAANSGPSFAALATNNTQPAFGGAAFQQSPAPAFGGGSSFSAWR